MNTIIMVLLILACTIAGLFVFGAAVEIYFNRKEKYFLKQVQTVAAVLGQAADITLKRMEAQKKESK